VVVPILNTAIIERLRQRQPPLPQVAGFVPESFNPVESSTAELGPGGIPTGGTFKVLKPTQAVQAASADGLLPFQAVSKIALNSKGTGQLRIKETVHALQPLEHFFSWFLSSKEFWAAIVGAVIGGFMTGWYALHAQKQAANDQRQRDMEIEQRAVKGTL
jgi:hypothetical protein